MTPQIDVFSPWPEVAAIAIGIFGIVSAALLVLLFFQRKG